MKRRIFNSQWILINWIKKKSTYFPGVGWWDLMNKIKAWYLWDYSMQEQPPSFFLCENECQLDAEFFVKCLCWARLLLTAQCLCFISQFSTSLYFFYTLKFNKLFLKFIYLFLFFFSLLLFFYNMILTLTTLRFLSRDSLRTLRYTTYSILKIQLTFMLLTLFYLHYVQCDNAHIFRGTSFTHKHKKKRNLFTKNQKLQKSKRLNCGWDW